MKVTLDDAVLADHGSMSVSQFRVRSSRLIQRADLFRAENPVLFDRKNRLKEISFSVTRLWKTVSDAEDFVANHDDGVPAVGLLMIETTKGQGQKRVRYIAGAACETTESSHTGITTFHSYTITGGAVLTVKPA